MSAYRLRRARLRRELAARAKGGAFFFRNSGNACPAGNHGPDSRAIRKFAPSIAKPCCTSRYKPRRPRGRVREGSNPFRRHAALSAHLWPPSARRFSQYARPINCRSSSSSAGCAIAGQRAEASSSGADPLHRPVAAENDLEELKDQVARRNGKLEAQNLQSDASRSHIAALPA